MGGIGAFRTQAALATRAANRFPIAVAVLSASVVGLELLRPVYAENPSALAGIETAITLSALLSAYLLLAAFQQRRRLRDLLLLSALAALSLMDFAFDALPALTGVDTAAPGDGARLGCEVVVAIAFAAAAFAPGRRLVGGGRRQVALTVVAAIGTVALAELLELIVGSHLASSALHDSGIAGVGAYPVSLTVQLLPSCVLLVSGIAFVARAGPGDRNAGLLAGASFLLAAAMLQYLALPTVAAGWVTPAAGLRLGAYALLLAVALRQDAKLRREVAWAAISAERERIARDLHDGLAQDLVVIAAHAPWLVSEFGPEHPLMIAARRALAASRGAIVDLSASAAPTTGAALRHVADELEARFDVQVNVRIKLDNAHGTEDLEPAEREEVVRIAREAIVNAVRHGGAHCVDVELDYSGPDLLRVSDNGCGIAEMALRSTGGFGLPTMRARAEAIGGRLIARRRANGGTELEVLVS